MWIPFLIVHKNLKIPFLIIIIFQFFWGFVITILGVPLSYDGIWIFKLASGMEVGWGCFNSSSSLHGFRYFCSIVPTLILFDIYVSGKVVLKFMLSTDCLQSFFFFFPTIEVIRKIEAHPLPHGWEGQRGLERERTPKLIVLPNALFFWYYQTHESA